MQGIVISLIDDMHIELAAVTQLVVRCLFYLLHSLRWQKNSPRVAWLL
jgi:hypothetical protein